MGFLLFLRVIIKLFIQLEKKCNCQIKLSIKQPCLHKGQSHSKPEGKMRYCQEGSHAKVTDFWQLIDVVFFLVMNIQALFGLGGCIY